MLDNQVYHSCKHLMHIKEPSKQMDLEIMEKKLFSRIDSVVVEVYKFKKLISGNSYWFSLYP